jgi:hypothetical protein
MGLMPSCPSQLRLTAGDCLIRALDHQMRQAGMPGNNCRVVLRLACKPDLARLRQRLAASPVFNWLSGARLVHPLPGLVPRWRTATPAGGILREEHCAANSRNEATGLPEAVLARPLAAGHGPLGLDLICHAEGTADLVLSWNHVLMDVHGAELLLRHLQNGSGAEGTVGAPQLHDAEQAKLGLTRQWGGFWRCLKVARGSLELIDVVGCEPLFSLLPTAQGSAACRNHYRVVAFNEAESERVEAYCQCLKAGFRRSLFHLAAAFQAVHFVAVCRGNGSGAYMVPVPHHTRRQGAAGPILSNQLSFLFYRIEPTLAGSMSGTLAELSRQMMEQIRHGYPESFRAAMEVFKIMPAGIYARRLGRATGGKLATFFFSDAGETCAGIQEVFGATIKGATHLAPASRPPGLAVIFSRFRRQLSATLAWVDDCLSAAEAEQLALALRSALLGEGMS